MGYKRGNKQDGHRFKWVVYNYAFFSLHSQHILVPIGITDVCSHLLQ